MKKYITGLLLLAFAVPSWAEDDVWYCVEEHNYQLEDQNKDGVYKLEHYEDEKFTLKHEADKNRLAIVGRTWKKDIPYYLDCDACNATLLSGMDRTVNFKILDNRFFYTVSSFYDVQMATGTCTKF
ncbi:hypothetical protein N9Y97_09800 [Pseudomonadales bacterium]|nr:hypothetical protein [Pseudomonadales bacterium]